jgi:hypothetical protein
MTCILYYFDFYSPLNLLSGNCTSIFKDSHFLFFRKFVSAHYLLQADDFDFDAHLFIKWMLVFHLQCSSRNLKYLEADLHQQLTWAVKSVQKQHA